MAEYTAYIPKEFFFEGLTVAHVFIAFVIILVIIVFFSYKFYRIMGIKRKPESF